MFGQICVSVFHHSQLLLFPLMGCDHDSSVTAIMTDRSGPVLGDKSRVHHCCAYCTSWACSNAEQTPPVSLSLRLWLMFEAGMLMLLWPILC